MTTMAAVRIWGAGDLRVERLPIPEPDEHQVRLRISHVGICGSDLHYWYDGANGDFVVREPLVPGHELSGRVDLDPSGTLRPGTPVTVHPARFGVSQPGLGSSPHLWPGGSYLGSAATWPHTQGVMAEFVVVDRTMVRVLPDSLPLDRAALAEPLAVALHALSQAGPVARARTLVVGAGPIGLLQVAALRAGGAATVAASDVARGPLARAQELGADSAYWVGAAGGEELPEGFEVVFECSGTASGVNSAWRAVRRGGTVVQVGMLPAGPQSLELSRLISKEVTVRTSFRFIDEIDDAIVLLDGRPEIAAVVTHCFGLGQVAQAFEVARDSEASGKVLVRLG